MFPAVDPVRNAADGEHVLPLGERDGQRPAGLAEIELKRKRDKAGRTQFPRHVRGNADDVIRGAPEQIPETVGLFCKPTENVTLVFTDGEACHHRDVFLAHGLESALCRNFFRRPLQHEMGKAAKLRRGKHGFPERAGLQPEFAEVGIPAGEEFFRAGGADLQMPAIQRIGAGA